MKPSIKISIAGAVILPYAVYVATGLTEALYGYIVEAVIAFVWLTSKPGE